MTNCEICNKEFSEDVFQKHLIEEHKLMFSQYIGLVSDRIDLVSFIEIKSPKKKKKSK